MSANDPKRTLVGGRDEDWVLVRERAIPVEEAMIRPALEAQPSFSPADLAKRTIYRRAVEAALWGMPIVASDAIRQGFLRDMGAKYNDIVYFSKPADWKFQTTTPNASTYYIYGAFTTQEGPVVLEVPAAVGAGIYGQPGDTWDVPLEIVGPDGEDKGQGGKYLILPPDFKGDVPAGYFPVRMQTWGGFWLLRTIPSSTSESDVANAIALIKKIRAAGGRDKGYRRLARSFA
jgi:hypothetical protein